MSPEVTAYLRRLRDQLRLDPRVEAEIVRELHDHLEDQANEFVQAGIPERQAWSQGLARFGRAESIAHSIRGAHLEASWTDTFFGGAAFLLPGALIGGGLWRNPFAVLAAAICVFAVVAVGLRQGRPLWFYPWVAIALIPPFIAGYIAFVFLSHQVMDLDAARSTAALVEIICAGLYFPVAGLGLATLILLVVRRDWLDASLMLAAIPPMLAWLVEVRALQGLANAQAQLHDLSTLIGSVYLGIAVAVVAFLRGQRRPRKVAALLIASVVLVSASSVAAGAGVLSFVLIRRTSLLLIFLLSPALTPRYGWRTTT